MVQRTPHGVVGDVAACSLVRRLGRSLLGARTVAAALAGAVVASGVAWATIPSSPSGVISSCYKSGGTPTGALRVIDYDAGQRCAAGEVLLTWNQSGINFKGDWSATTNYLKNDAVAYAGASYLAKAPSKGVVPTTIASWAVLAARGTPGPAGRQGPTGPTGPTGPQGIAGGTGATGSPGPAGPAGARGFPGLPGRDGQDGAQGPQGPPGLGSVYYDEVLADDFHNPDVDTEVLRLSGLPAGMYSVTAVIPMNAPFGVSGGYATCYVYNGVEDASTETEVEVGHVWELTIQKMGSYGGELVVYCRATIEFHVWRASIQATPVANAVHL